MSVEIRSVGGRVLYVAEGAQDVRVAVQAAVRSRADLSRAYLSRADLSGADLSGADLPGANLSRADLSGADLSGADLPGANLSRADLSRADLSRAYLPGADLSGAYLSRADLSRADLSGADLSGAYLSGADLSRADLSGADNPGGPLHLIRSDVWTVLDGAPGDVAGLRTALVAGRIDGAVYEGDCACLVGTLAKVHEVAFTDLPGLTPDGGRPAEQWFMPIKPGDVPVALDELPGPDSEQQVSEGVLRASWALAWVDAWREQRLAVARALLGQERAAA